MEDGPHVAEVRNEEVTPTEGSEKELGLGHELRIEDYSRSGLAGATA